MYAHLEPQKVLATVEQLHRRVYERFPDASLTRLIAELGETARQSVRRAAWIRRPLWRLRLLSALAIVSLPVGLLLLEEQVTRSAESMTVAEFIQTLEAALGSVVFLGAAVLFVVTLEARYKRGRALQVIHELRSMAHIVDMHQLTKDPERMLAGPDTPSSPARTLTPFELGRYYDYCSETLSLISKIAAVHMQGFHDAVVLEAVDEIENLCTGLSRKIWQKIMLLDQIVARASESAPPPLLHGNA